MDSAKETKGHIGVTTTNPLSERSAVQHKIVRVGLSVNLHDAKTDECHRLI